MVALQNVRITGEDIAGIRSDRSGSISPDTFRIAAQGLGMDDATPNFKTAATALDAALSINLLATAPGTGVTSPAVTPTGVTQSEGRVL